MLVAFPKLFQLWVAKHIALVAGIRAYLWHQTGETTTCPCCKMEPETTYHITWCTHPGQQQELNLSIDLLDQWMTNSHTDPPLWVVVVEYLQHWGNHHWMGLLQHYPLRFSQLGVEQDRIGWDGFTMGMISTEFQRIQADHLAVNSSCLSLAQWMRRFIMHLMQISHGQWVYGEDIVHDELTGIKCSKEKQDIHTWIIDEWFKGLEDLLPQRPQPILYAGKGSRRWERFPTTILATSSGNNMDRGPSLGTTKNRSRVRQQSCAYPQTDVWKRITP